MSANLAQSLSLAGVLLVLLGYGGNQYADLRSDGLLNLVGSTLLALPAFKPLNLGVLVLESAWALISLGITVRALGRKPTASPPPAA
jgi:hypothetical protein